MIKESVSDCIKQYSFFTMKEGIQAGLFRKIADQLFCHVRTGKLFKLPYQFCVYNVSDNIDNYKKEKSTMKVVNVENEDKTVPLEDIECFDYFYYPAEDLVCQKLRRGNKHSLHFEVLPVQANAGRGPRLVTFRLKAMTMVEQLDTELHYKKVK